MPHRKVGLDLIFGLNNLKRNKIMGQFLAILLIIINLFALLKD
jgi:hypothetical protein